ncbi:MAG: hypothetical protein IJ749_01885 [Eubacterium sp.]|nr:hypothetical protein [Eubacterium sp.]
MIISTKNKNLSFKIDAPPSKSIYHRELIIRFLCGDFMHLSPKDGDNDDILATKAVLSALYSATHSQDTDSPNYNPKYLADEGTSVLLACNESGSTLRFMIPVAAALILGKYSSKKIRDTKVTRLVFETKGRLFDRPLDELEDALRPHGINISKDSSNRTIIVEGEMTPGEYVIDGSVSSQYISGLLMACTLFDDKCTIRITGSLKSIHYIELTQDVLEKYGVPASFSDMTYYPTPNGYANSLLSTEPVPEELKNFKVEGDWSNGAFLLCMKRWSSIEVTNLREDSKQGDRAILDYLSLADSENAPSEITWDCSDIPDITPYMAMVAPFEFAKVTFTGISRLRIKESDRVMATREQLAAIGVRTEETEDTLTVYEYESPSKEELEEPIRLSSYNDHRMAMCAILLAVILKKDVEIDSVECLKKSFPEFLGYLGKYFK